MGRNCEYSPESEDEWTQEEYEEYMRQQQQHQMQYGGGDEEEEGEEEEDLEIEFIDEDPYYEPAEEGKFHDALMWIDRIELTFPFIHSRLLLPQTSSPTLIS